MNNRDKFIDMIADWHLERMEVADLLSVDEATVGHWLLPHGSHHSEEIPTMAVELLAFKLAGREKPKSET